MDGATGELTIEENDGVQTRIRKLPHLGTLYDGGGIVMLIRSLSSSEMDLAVPTIVDREIRRTRLTFTTEVKDADPDVLPGPARLRRVKGNAEWVTQSVAGLTGTSRTSRGSSQAARETAPRISALAFSVARAASRVTQEQCSRIFAISNK